ncbi:hypothetical protein PIB30_051353 [Stylosanthes scabra]|uniref:Benzyl alcohol O-benzoyltransferase n=1 Tax=Stylosanthes scabra TaxID=79078 RepID=A0ABU6ZGP6_9FABA|nr:hypothetical protein [Stylosanthes scabra]
MLLRKSSLSSALSMMFKVRSPAKIVAPAGPTPHELKLLSDIDDQPGLRLHLPLVQFYSYNPSMARKDPVRIIREALSKALVFYYPLAGRLREGTNGKLMVDCTAEGVLFIEADADVTLDQFGVDIMPPFPCFDELLYLAPSFDTRIINTPLLVIQVTRLKCGGFIFAIRMNRTMFDGAGLGLFLNAIAEIARGALKPSITPVWCRDLLCARDPPRVTSLLPEYQQQQQSVHDHRTLSSSKACKGYFFFGPKEIDALRRLFPPHLAHSSSTFEVLTAFLWRCRTAAMDCQNPNQEAHLMYPVSACFGPARFNPLLPEGYYGNTFVGLRIVSTVGMLCGHPLSYVLELVKKSKKEASEEYVHSTIDRLATKGRPPFTSAPGTFAVSDNTKYEFRDVNFRWGKPLYSGLAESEKAGGVHGSDRPKIRFDFDEIWVIFGPTSMQPELGSKPIKPTQ